MTAAEVRFGFLSTTVFALAWSLSHEAQALAAAGQMVPHRAIYEMSLEDVRSGSGISAIDGRMVFEFTGSECDGYSLNMRMVTQMTDSQGLTNLTDLRSSTWEQGQRQEVPLSVGTVSKRQAR